MTITLNYQGDIVPCSRFKPATPALQIPMLYTKIFLIYPTTRKTLIYPDPDPFKNSYSPTKKTWFIKFKCDTNEKPLSQNPLTLHKNFKLKKKKDNY